MILKRIQVKTTQPNLLTNAYIVCDEESKETLVVDPGGEAERLAEMIDVLGGELKYIFVTHCHADHIGGIAKLKELKGGKVLINTWTYKRRTLSIFRKERICIYR